MIVIACCGSSISSREALSYGQDETGRIWDVLTVLRFEIQHKIFKDRNAEQEILFHVLFVMGSKRQKVQLKATGYTQITTVPPNVKY